MEPFYRYTMGPSEKEHGNAGISIFFERGHTTGGSGARSKKENTTSGRKLPLQFFHFFGFRNGLQYDLSKSLLMNLAFNDERNHFIEGNGL